MRVPDRTRRRAPRRGSAIAAVPGDRCAPGGAFVDPFQGRCRCCCVQQANARQPAPGLRSYGLRFTADGRRRALPRTGGGRYSSLQSAPRFMASSASRTETIGRALNSRQGDEPDPTNNIQSPCPICPLRRPLGRLQRRPTRVRPPSRRDRSPGAGACCCWSSRSRSSRDRKSVV